MIPLLAGINQTENEKLTQARFEANHINTWFAFSFALKTEFLNHAVTRKT